MFIILSASYGLPLPTGALVLLTVPTHLTTHMVGGNGAGSYTRHLSYKIKTLYIKTATGYGLDGPGIECRWGARFSVPVQTGPEAHPASCTMGTGSFPGVKYGPVVTLTPHPFLVPWL